MLEARDLHVSYGAVPALRGIDLSVTRGEAVAILGRNGAGKTTALRALAGLMRPWKGSISLDGHEVLGVPAERRVSLGVALVPEGRRLFPELSVRENLALGAYRRRVWGSRLHADLDGVCDVFPRLGERMNQPAGSLSGGEQQMLAVGRGLMSHPRLLLVDEPSLGLAPVAVEELYGVFADLRAGGLTFVIVEQHVEVALDFADRAYVLDKGRVALSGSGLHLDTSTTLADVYLSGAQQEVRT